MSTTTPMSQNVIKISGKNIKINHKPNLDQQQAEKNQKIQGLLKSISTGKKECAGSVAMAMCDNPWEESHMIANAKERAVQATEELKRLGYKFKPVLNQKKK
jgi:hypothetical protein